MTHLQSEERPTPTEPGWCRMRVPVTSELPEPYERALERLPQDVPLEVWWAVECQMLCGVLVAYIEGSAIPVSTVNPARWGARVEFPGDEPAIELDRPRPAGTPLTVRDRCARSDGELRQLNGCTAQAAEALGVRDPSAFSWEDVLDEVRKLRAPAAGPLTPDSEGWWWHRCGEPDKPEGMCDWQPRRVVVRLSGPGRGDLVFDYGLVKDDGRWGGRAVPPVTPAVEADEPTLEPPPGWELTQLSGGGWWCRKPARCRRSFDRPTRAEAIAAAWEGEAEAAKDESLPVGVPRALEPDWTWVDACPDGQRRRQIVEVGDAIETRIVDRRDEP